MLLLELGANIHYVARGAARAGDTAFAEKLRRRYSASINMIAQGAGEFGDQMYINFLQMHDASISRLAQGYAVRGDWPTIRELQKKGAKFAGIVQGALEGRQLKNPNYLFEKEFVDLGFLLLYAGLYGQPDLIKEQQQKGMSVNLCAQGFLVGGYLNEVEHLVPSGANIDYMAAAAARSGHLYLAEFLRRRGAKIHVIAAAAAAGGHLNYAKYLKSQGADINTIASSVAQSGNFEYAKELFEEGASPSRIACGAAMGGHEAFAEYFRALGADKREIIRGAIKGGYWEYAHRLAMEEPVIDINIVAGMAAFYYYNEYGEFLRMNHGANIDWMAYLSAKAGNYGYTEYLRMRGANLEKIIKGCKDGNSQPYLDYLATLDDANIRTALAAFTSEIRPDNEVLKSPEAEPSQPVQGDDVVALNVDTLFADAGSPDDSVTDSDPMLLEVTPLSYPPTPEPKEKEPVEQSLKRSQKEAELSEIATEGDKHIRKRPKKANEKNALFSGKYSKKYERVELPYFIAKKSESASYQNSFQFQTLESARKKEGRQRQIKNLVMGKSNFRFASNRNDLPSTDETVTFVFAGRLHDAMIPNPSALGEKQRLLLVVGNYEYEGLNEYYYNENIEFLIIDSLLSETHGNYHPDDIQSRRLAAFIVSFEWRLKNCIYLDDNLSLLQSQSEFSSLSSWAETTASLAAARDSNKAVMCGMQTLSRRPHHHEPDYCYKLFVFDFQLAARILSLRSIEDVFILGYPERYSGYCMQDFYFQMVIDFALEELINAEDGNDWLPQRLMHLPKLEEISLLRAKHQKNSARTFTRGYIEDIYDIDVDSFPPPKVSGKQAEIMKAALLHMKKEIKRCLKNVDKLHRQAESGDFRDSLDIDESIEDIQEKIKGKEPELKSRTISKQKKNGKGASSSSLVIPESWVGSKLNERVPAEKMEEFLQKQEIREYLYPYQADALRAMGNCDESKGVWKISPGGGKTLVGIVLSTFLISQNPQGVIHIVVPTVQLVDQYRQEFKKFLKRMGNDCPIKSKNVISVDSKENAVSKNFLNKNKVLQKKASVLIFCLASYSKLLEDKDLEKHRAPLMVILDEHHLYSRKATKLLNSGVPSIGFSATPDNSLKPFYVFNRADSRRVGTTAPLIVDRLSFSLDMKKNLRKHEKLAQLIWVHRHPMKEPLASYKGIIFTSSIKEANELADAINEVQLQKLTEAGKPLSVPKLAYAIHSNVDSCREWIEDFKAKSLTTPGIRIVVDMLGTGYDDQDVAWAIYAKNNGSSIANHSQMIGRVIRKNPRFPNKIAYFLTDDELILDPDDTPKDKDALEMAHSDYFRCNREVIYFELLNAIDKKRPFVHYRPLFEQNLLDYSLSKCLLLLLKAVLCEAEEWSKGMLDTNKTLKESWRDARGTEFNLLEMFINEVIGLNAGHKDPLKESLINIDSLDKLLDVLDTHAPQFLTQLSEKNGIKERLKKVDANYTTIFRKYRCLNTEKVLGSFIISEGRQGVKIRTNPNCFLSPQTSKAPAESSSNNDKKECEQSSPTYWG